MNDFRAPIVATYRIQLTPSLGFADTIDILDHLTSLGVSHLYLSPVAEAVPGSLHGYDVIDHTTVRSDFGGRDALFELLDACADVGLGVVIDHVPNHMSVAEAHLNERWWDMLRDGPQSPAASWFDVDWAGANGKVIVPKLGEPIDRVIAAGGFEIGDGDLGPELRYGPLRFPLAPGTERLDVASALYRQHYRLAWWRDPRRNVRRFFTIDDLVAVRADDAHVAEVIDTIPTLLASHPAFAGVRVDHVDGLAAPEAYLHGLRRRIGDERWLLVEKIVAVAEWLPPSWPVDGTTGYEHIRVTEHTMLEPAAESPLTGQWVEATGDDRDFVTIEDTARREVLDGGLRPDLDRLVSVVAVSGHGEAATRDAVVELTIGVHRYRTYLPDDAESVAELASAHERALAVRPDLRDELDRIVDLLRAAPAVATRWEQLCSPVMAKGAEDRAFYRYMPLASLCEVGGAPGQWSLTPVEFHRHQYEVQQRTPVTMLAGTTHDTKRSEGVRARSLALAEMAPAWTAAVRDWLADHREVVDGLDAATVLLALQTAVTAWPIDAERLTDYLVKSTREADQHTSWTDPQSDYESTLARLAEELERELTQPADFDPVHHPLADLVVRSLRPGWASSLSSLAIRLTAPGVPDLYQGTTAFTYSLVDPDNRVEPDWSQRRALVDEARGVDGPSAWLGTDVEAAKAVVIVRTLAARRRHATAFGSDAGYEPLAVTGDHADRVVAFARSAPSGPSVVTVATIRSVGVPSWGSTFVELPAGTWRDVLSDRASDVEGGLIPLERWLASFPAAILERVDTTFVHNFG